MGGYGRTNFERRCQRLVSIDAGCHSGLGVIMVSEASGKLMRVCKSGKEQWRDVAGGFFSGGYSCLWAMEAMLNLCFYLTLM